MNPFLKDFRRATRLAQAGLRGWMQQAEAALPTPPGGAQFLRGHVTCSAGTYPYRLYVPAAARGQALPLVVMLHGCGQTPEDFARGTGMNEAAERMPCLVLYPGQIAAANHNGCWNWFLPEHQGRDTGEPAIIAGMVRAVMQTQAVDQHRVFAAGLSAGGAMAAILGATYPDMFAAIGVHSGLAFGAAHDLNSALSAMRNGARGRASPPLRVPAILFHGDGDHIVHPANGDALAAQLATDLPPRTERGEARGRPYTQRVYDLPGRRVEYWRIQGGTHGWSGGSPAGSFTDPQGPDATRAMLRFFTQAVPGQASSQSSPA